MVGTGKWSTEDAKMVFEAKLRGASDELVIQELLRLDPRRSFKRGSIKYVVDHFKNLAEVNPHCYKTSTQAQEEFAKSHKLDEKAKQAKKAAPRKQDRPQTAQLQQSHHSQIQQNQYRPSEFERAMQLQAQGLQVQQQHRHVLNQQTQQQFAEAQRRQAQQKQAHPQQAQQQQTRRQPQAYQQSGGGQPMMNEIGQVRAGSRPIVNQEILDRQFPSKAKEAARAKTATEFKTEFARKVNGGMQNNPTSCNSANPQSSARGPNPLAQDFMAKLQQTIDRGDTGSNQVNHQNHPQGTPGQQQTVNCYGAIFPDMVIFPNNAHGWKVMKSDSRATNLPDFQFFSPHEPLVINFFNPIFARGVDFNGLFERNNAKPQIASPPPQGLGLHGLQQGTSSQFGTPMGPPASFTPRSDHGQGGFNAMSYARSRSSSVAIAPQEQRPAALNPINHDLARSSSLAKTGQEQTQGEEVVLLEDAQEQLDMSDLFGDNFEDCEYPNNSTITDGTVDEPLRSSDSQSISPERTFTEQLADLGPVIEAPSPMASPTVVHFPNQSNNTAQDTPTKNTKPPMLMRVGDEFYDVNCKLWTGSWPLKTPPPVTWTQTPPHAAPTLPMTPESAAHAGSKRKASSVEDSETTPTKRSVNVPKPVMNIEDTINWSDPNASRDFMEAMDQLHSQDDNNNYDDDELMQLLSGYTDGGGGESFVNPADLERNMFDLTCNALPVSAVEFTPAQVDFIEMVNQGLGYPYGTRPEFTEKELTVLTKIGTGVDATEEEIESMFKLD